MSIHTDKARAVAARLGAFAGHDHARELWALSKRELVEVAMRLGARASGDADSPSAGARVALHEVATLRKSGII